MPRHALRSELATKLTDGWTGAAGRHVLDSEMPTPTGTTGRQALSSEVSALVVGPAAVTYTGSAVAKSTAATSVVGAVTGCAVGDVLVAFASGNDQNTSVTPPASLGWTLIGDSTAGFGRTFVYVTVATSANQSGGTWTWPGSHNHVVAILSYRNVATPTTAVTAKVTTAVTTLAVPSVTTTKANSVLLVWGFYTTNGTAPVWSGGTFTVRVPNNTSTASGVAADEPRPTAGATGTRTFTPGGSPSAMSVASLALELP